MKFRFSILIPMLLTLGACSQTASDSSALSGPGSQAALYAAGLAAGFDPTGISGMVIGQAAMANAMARAHKQQAMIEEQYRIAVEMQKEFADAPAEPRRKTAAKPPAASAPAAAE